MSTDEPIRATIDRWHQHLRGELPGGLESLLREDCVFWSPVVFRPQEGRDLTMLYLNAAGQVFPGEESGGGSSSGSSKGSFRYTKKVLEGHTAVLEFETQFGDVSVNGIDMITCDDDGQIVEFKVMLRPQKAVEAARDRMSKMIAAMTAE